LLPRHIGKRLKKIKNMVVTTIVRLSHGRRFDVMVFPERPTRHHLLFWSVWAAGGTIRYYSSVSECRLLFFFHDATCSPPSLTTFAKHEFRNKTVINGRCVDISKLYIDQRHIEVFGYGLNLTRDALQGREDELFVVKSNENCRHDGVLTPGRDCDGKLMSHDTVVQEYIDTTVMLDGEPHLCDLRVGVGGDKILYVVQKYKTKDHTFRSYATYMALAQPDLVFSNKEKEKLLAFARAVNLDLGELDVLADRTSRRLFVCDVSRTPMRLSPKLRSDELAYCYRKIADVIGSYAARADLSG